MRTAPRGAAAAAKSRRAPRSSRRTPPRRRTRSAALEVGRWSGRGPLWRRAQCLPMAMAHRAADATRTRADAQLLAEASPPSGDDFWTDRGASCRRIARRRARSSRAPSPMTSGSLHHARREPPSNDRPPATMLPSPGAGARRAPPTALHAARRRTRSRQNAAAVRPRAAALHTCGAAARLPTAPASARVSRFHVGTGWVRALDSDRAGGARRRSRRPCSAPRAPAARGRARAARRRGSALATRRRSRDSRARRARRAAMPLLWARRDGGRRRARARGGRSSRTDDAAGFRTAAELARCDLRRGAEAVCSARGRVRA